MSIIFTPIKVTGMPGYQRHWLIMALFFGTSFLVLWSNYTKFKPGGITFIEGTILFHLHFPAHYRFLECRHRPVSHGFWQC
jgi:hypothetical protein